MKGCLCIHCDEFVAASESVRVGKYRAHPWCEENSKRMKSALTEVAGQIIADCEEEERNDGSRVAAEAKGRDRLDCVADFNTACVDSHTDYAKAMTVRKPEASSDPLAVAARMERAEAEVARLREALRKLISYNQDIMAGKINYRPVDHIQVAEAALGKEQNG